MPWEANDIVVVSGPLPVDELNKRLWVSGYVRRMFFPSGHLAARRCSGQEPFLQGGLITGLHSP